MESPVLRSLFSKRKNSFNEELFAEELDLEFLSLRIPVLTLAIVNFSHLFFLKDLFVRKRYEYLCVRFRGG
jgi:hypothetical protein